MNATTVLLIFSVAMAIYVRRKIIMATKDVFKFCAPINPYIYKKIIKGQKKFLF